MILKRGLTILVLLILTAPTLAAEPDPKTVAPLVDEACILVAHVDLAKVSVDPVFDEAIRFVDALFENNKQPDANKQLLAMRTQVNVARVAADQLLKMATEGLKINDAYAIFSLQDVFPEPAMFLAAPIHDGLDPKKIGDFAKTFKLGQPERVGDFLVLVLNDERTRKPVLARLESIRPDARPELAEALAAVGPAPIRITVTFPKYAQEVFEDVAPRLPERIGGQRTGELLGGTRWIALGVDPEKVALNGIVQCNSPEAAKKARDLIEKGIMALHAVEPEVSERLPKADLDRFLAEHGPKIEKDRVVWTLAGGDPGGKALRALLLKLVPPPGEPAPPAIASPEKPRRILPPKIDPQKAAERAIEQYDTDKDGKIAGKELDGAAALKAAIGNLDTDYDGAVTRDEIAARIEWWKKSRLGRMAMPCAVKYRGKPLPDATVVCEPEEFLGDGVPEGRGVTDAQGRVMLAIPGLTPPGMAPGFYRVKITAKGVNLPEKYNKKTILGLEVALDAAGLREGLVFSLD